MVAVLRHRCGSAPEMNNTEYFTIPQKHDKASPLIRFILIHLFSVCVLYTQWKYAQTTWMGHPEPSLAAAIILCTHIRFSHINDEIINDWIIIHS